ncbi:MAG: hypothetical protein A2X49_14735 [Lentisphaerae bacterium GWF2_52_8]|nr:MAG: hypothetical protein A2X49_14735 [Lentisphaerae bacterium GWF2_52_8]
MEDIHKTRLTLIQRVKDSGDEAAWEEFVAVYRKYLYIVARNMNLSHHDAEEIVQRVFAKVWEKMPGFNYLPQKGRFRHWLCSIARNMAIDLIRSRKAKGYPGEEGEGNNLFDEAALPDIELMAEKEWRNYLANMALEFAQKEFSSLEFECFVRYANEKTPAEIAKELEVAENTVYVYCRRVKLFIRKKITELGIHLD